MLVLIELIVSKKGANFRVKHPPSGKTLKQSGDFAHDVRFAVIIFSMPNIIFQIFFVGNIVIFVIY